MSSDSDAEEKETTKFIQCLCRVNPKCGYKSGTVNVDSEFNEVSVSRGNSAIHKASSKSYVVDAVLDIMPGKDDEKGLDGKKVKTQWASQAKVFEQVRTMVDRRVQEEGSDILVLANGASGSGKTYTMFGESNFEDKGIVPRFVDYIYKHKGKSRYLAVEDIADAPPALAANKVLLSMMLISGEQMTDLLHVNNPLRMWSPANRIAYSGVLGPVALPAEYVLSASAEELSDQLGMGLKVAATVIHSTTDLYASTSIVVTMLIISGDVEKVREDATTKMFGKKTTAAEEAIQAEKLRITKVTFMELPSVDNPHPCPVEVDRLTGVSALYRAARCLQLDPSIGAGGGGGGNPYVPGQFNAHHRKSIVNYLLQDSLYKYPNAIIINCLRGAEHSYEQDIATMDLMGELSENFNTDGTSKKQLRVVECIRMLYDEVRQCEYGAGPDPFAEYVQQLAKTASDQALGGKKGAPAAKISTMRPQRRLKEVKPLHEYSDVVKSDAALLRNKATFLKRLAQIFEFMIKKDEASKEAMQRLCNYTLPFVPAFDVSMNTPRRGVVVDFDRLADDSIKVPFTDVLRAWLKERGLFLKFIKPSLGPMGVYDLMDLGDDEEDKFKPFVPDPGEVKQNTTGVAHGVPWSYEIEGMDPYAIMLSPNSGLADSYAKIPLVRGYTVIRGKTGNTYLSENQSMTAYTTTPVEKDTEKDVISYRASIRDLVGENMLPQEALQILDEEIAAEIAATLEVDKHSKASDNIDEFDNPETELKKKEERTKEVVNFVYLPGPAVEAVHAIFRVENAQFLFLRPNNLLMINGKAVKPEIYVNGLLLSEEIPLQDNDVVQIGRSRFLQIRVPVKPIKMNEINSVAREEKFSELTIWERGMVRAFAPKLKEAIGLSEANRRHVSHIAINRELTAVMKNADRTPLHRMDTYLAPEDLIASVYTAISPNDRAYCCNIVGASNLVNYWGAVMRRYMKASFELVATAHNDLAQRGRIIVLNTSTLAASAAAQATVNQGKKTKRDVEYDEFGVPIDHDDDAYAQPVVEQVVPGGRRKGIRQVGGNNTAEATADERIFSGSICCENVGDAAGKFMWNCPILQERLYLMKGMAEQYHSSWCACDTAWLDAMYEPNQDPFNDTQEDELIGVGYLYLDSLQYLVDTNDVVPIVSLQGHRCGAIKIRGRAWIDKIETAPPYLTVDKETNLRDFDGKNCVLRLYIESLMDLPANHCSSTFVRFNFFYHNKPYITARHGGCSQHPFLHNAIRIDQRITGDFLEYIARGSLEMEVYGKRKVKESRRPGLGLTIKHNFLTGETIPEINIREVDDEAGQPDMSKGEDEEEKGDDLEEKIRELTINLQKSQNAMNTSKKIIENLTADKVKLEHKIERQESKFAEFEETLPEKFRSVKGASGSTKSGKNAPVSDGSVACTVM